MKVIIKIVLFMMIPLSGFGVVKYTTIRPLEIQVVDATTKQPLPNMVVYYALKSEGQRFFGILNDPINFRAVQMERFVTDENGKVYIPKYRMWLGLNEKAFSEEFTVNLDIEPTKKMPHDQNKFFFDHISGLTGTLFWLRTSVVEALRSMKLFCPNEQYRCIILASVFSCSGGDELLSRELVEGRCLVVSQAIDLHKEKQIITFELEHTDALHKK